MVFQVPAKKKSIGQDKFDFKIGAVAFSIKKAKFLSIGELESLESDGSAAITFFGGKAGTKQGDAIRGLDGEQFQALVQAWREDSEVTQGE